MFNKFLNISKTIANVLEKYLIINEQQSVANNLYLSSKIVMKGAVIAK